MVWKRARRPFAGVAGSRRRAPGFECHGSRPAFRGPRNMETDGIMRKEDGPIRHKEIFKESDGPVRKGKGWPAGSDLIGSCHPVLVSMVRGKGFPRRAPAGSRTRRRHKGENKDGTGGGLGASGKERIWARPWARAADHSSEPSVSAGAFASRRRDAISRPAPPPSTTTAASAISAMPAPVWARVLR